MIFLDKAVKVSQLSKRYTLYQSNRERMLDVIAPKKEHGQSFYALKSVDFEAETGEVVGFIGINGSGKSTLSNIIAGIVPETSGRITINGQVALIAVAAGLKNDLTGRDNIELKLLMLGFNKDEIRSMEADIIEFAELEQFIDQPVKSYSSGMKSRLGFSISVTIDPDIFIIDEALSVGDKAFAEKSLAKMNEFKRDGKTMIFVSHSIGQMKEFCDKILWLEYGRVKMYGTVKEVMPEYEAFLKVWKKMSKSKRQEYRKQVESEILDYEAFVEEVHRENEKWEYVEKLVSRIGQIRAGESFIYQAPDNLTAPVSSQHYKKCSYFIKKQVVFRDRKFYLISTEPSAVQGVIGWMKATDMATHGHVQVDFDPKEFRFLGAGRAYDRPWGSKKNVIYSELKSRQGLRFVVERTDKVGKNVWYYGSLKGSQEKVWIHENHIESIKDDTQRITP